MLASDRVAFRLGLAEQLGATVVDVSATDDVAGWFHEHTEGDGIDVVFEMSGAAASIGDAFRIVRNGGHVVLFGIPARPVEIDVAESLIFKNLTVTAVSGRQVFATWYRTRWLLEHGVVDLRPLITHEHPLADFEQAFAELERGEACKIVLYPGGAAEPVTALPAEEAQPSPRLARWAHR